MLLKPVFSDDLKTSTAYHADQLEKLLPQLRADEIGSRWDAIVTEAVRILRNISTDNPEFYDNLSNVQHSLILLNMGAKHIMNSTELPDDLKGRLSNYAEFIAQNHELKILFKDAKKLDTFIDALKKKGKIPTDSFKFSARIQNDARKLFPSMDNLFTMIKATDSSDLAGNALARHWKKYAAIGPMPFALRWIAGSIPAPNHVYNNVEYLQALRNSAKALAEEGFTELQDFVTKHDAELTRVREESEAQVMDVINRERGKGGWQVG